MKAECNLSWFFCMCTFCLAKSDFIVRVLSLILLSGMINECFYRHYCLGLTMIAVTDNTVLEWTISAVIDTTVWSEGQILSLILLSGVNEECCHWQYCLGWKASAVIDATVWDEKQALSFKLLSGMNNKCCHWHYCLKWMSAVIETNICN